MNKPHFNGPEYDHDRDHRRLKTQLERVRGCMFDCRWRTLNEIKRMTGDPVASISAQLRHLRKARFGSWVIERRLSANAVGLYEYMMRRPRPDDPQTKLIRINDLQKKRTRADLIKTIHNLSEENYGLRQRIRQLTHKQMAHATNGQGVLF